MSSFRQLAAEAGMEPSQIQKISVGKVDLTTTKLIAIATALGLSFSEFVTYYNKVTDRDEREFINYFDVQWKLKGAGSVRNPIR